MNKVIHKKSTSTINAKGVMKRHFKSALALFMPLFVVSCLTLTSGYILSSSLSGAVETEAITTSVRVLEACSVAADSLTHSTSTVGGGVTTLGTTTFDVSCNDRNGYSLYAVGYGNDTVGNTDLTGATTGSTIPTGTDMSANVSNWAMRLTAVNDSAYFVPTILSDTNGSFTENHVVPSTDTKVVTFKNAIDVSKPSRFTATYTAATTFAQAPDTYTGQVRYTLVHPNYTNADGTTESYAVTLALNNAESIIIDGTTYTAGSATPSLTYGTHTISGVYPANYEFSSWSSTGSISIASVSTASTTMTVSGAGTLTLNAKQSVFCTSSDSNCMQYYTLASCPTSGATVMDARDGKTYTVKKINGYCWMTQNLRFTGTSVPSATSNVTSDKTLTYFQLDTNGSSGGKCYDSTGYDNACIKDSGSTTTGVWYNYYAATAGAVSGNSNSTDASQDICPKNWRLPTGPNTTSGTDFNKLMNSTSGSWMAISDFPGVASGYYESGSYSGQGFFGRWWSATAFGIANRYTLFYDSSDGEFIGSGSSYRYNGYFVRCVMKPTMQDATASSLAALMPNTGDTTTLVDSRDGKEYSVTKLADGKYWMTSNLDLAGGTTLTSSDSNVTSNYTLPASSSSPDFDSDYAATVYNSGSTDCSASKGCYSYYSYLAATASTGSSVSTSGYNASGSICPKGWRLPTSTTSNAGPQSNNNWKTGDFYALAKAYGANLESNYFQYSGTFYTNAGPGTTPNFLLSGIFGGTSFLDGGSGGYYWSSTASSSSYAFGLKFVSSLVDSAVYESRRYGFAVRCVYAG